MNVTRELEVHECPVCFITYAAPKRLFEAKCRNGSSFFCPNGHSLSFHDDENDKLRRERDQLKQQLAEKDDRIDELVAAKYAVITEAKRLARRAHAGTCPHCQRSFANMARHIRHQHPEEVKAVLVVK
jgi:hypothetical protein